MAKRGPKPKYSRDEIASIAYNRMVSRGDLTLTLAEIASHLGTTPSALYRYFPSKSELDRAIRPYGVERALERLCAEPTAPTDANDMRREALARLWQILKRWTGLLKEEPTVYALSIATLCDDDVGTTTLLRPIAQAIEHCTRVAAIRPGSDFERARLLVGAIHGVSTLNNQNLVDSVISTVLYGWGASQLVVEGSRALVESTS